MLLRHPFIILRGARFSFFSQLGGDWEELGRTIVPVRLYANGVLIHDFLPIPEVTVTREFLLPEEALDTCRGGRLLELRFEPRPGANLSYINVPMPIAELWLLTAVAAEDADQAVPPEVGYSRL